MNNNETTILYRFGWRTQDFAELVGYNFFTSIELADGFLKNFLYPPVRHSSQSQHIPMAFINKCDEFYPYEKAKLDLRPHYSTPETIIIDHVKVRSDSLLATQARIHRSDFFVARYMDVVEIWSARWHTQMWGEARKVQIVDQESRKYPPPAMGAVFDINDAKRPTTISPKPSHLASKADLTP